MNALRLLSISLSWLALAAVPGLAACAATPGADTDPAEHTDSAAEALCPVGVVCGPGTTPPPSTTPPAGTYVQITSSDLLFEIQTVLDGSGLSVDTTGTAPPVAGALVSVPNPLWVSCSEATDCYDDTGPKLAACLKEGIARCAAIPKNIEKASEYSSYVQFSPYAKQLGATDALFTLKAIPESFLGFSFDVDINYLHATIDHNIQASFVQGPATNDPSISLYLPSGTLTSNSPTLIPSGEIPNVNLTNMALGVTLGGFLPTSDGLSLDYGTVESTFSCNSDINDLPDDVVDVFYDVQAKVVNTVESQMNSAFSSAPVHKALSKALTGLASNAITQVHGAGYSRITKVIGIGSSWYVYYVGK